MNYLEQIKRDRIAGDLDQGAVNFGKRESVDEIRARAERRVNSERYPQYRGHFTSYKLVVVTRRIVTKAGVAFENGDVTLGKYEEAGSCYEGSPAGWVAFSFRNGIDTAVGKSAMKI